MITMIEKEIYPLVIVKDYEDHDFFICKRTKDMIAVTMIYLQSHGMVAGRWCPETWIISQSGLKDTSRSRER